MDILVTFEGDTDFDRFMGLKLELEDLFERPVDPGTPDMLWPAIRERIQKDLIPVP